MQKIQTGAIFKASKVLVILLIFLTITWLVFCTPDKKPQNNSANSYRVLKDELGPEVLIGVRVCTTDEELRETLTAAANALQDVRGRDYILSNHLTIKAFLLIEQSPAEQYAAGSIRRHVPLPEEKDGYLRWFDWFVSAVSGGDRFVIDTEEARENIRQNGLELKCSDK